MTGARAPQTGPAEFDIAARQAHVVAQEPRIPALANDEISREAFDLVNAVRAGAGAGPAEIMPEYMRLMVKHRDIFRAQMDLGAALYNGKLPPRQRELAILRVAWLTRSPYEWGEHVDIAKRNGVTAEEVERTTQGSSAAGWSENDATIIRAAEELLADYAISDSTWDKLAAIWDERQLIEFPVMIGQYVAIAFVQNSLRVRLAEDNPGLSHR
jgi:alkylhydroperoxidase family enzyme